MCLKRVTLQIINVFKSYKFYMLMMKYHQFLVVFFLNVYAIACVPVVGLGQVGKVDSLKYLLRHEKNMPPALVVERAVALGKALEAIQTDSALAFTEQAIEIARAQHIKPSLAKALWLRAKILIHLGRFPEAMKTLEESQKIYVSLPDNTGLADVLNMMGNVRKNQNQYEAARDFYTQALEQAKIAKDSENIAGIHINIGITFDFAGDYPKAIDSYLKALKYFEKLGNKDDMALALSNIGIVHFYNGDFKEAIRNLQIANNLYYTTGDNMKVCRGETNLGDVYAEMDSFEAAKKCYQRADNLLKTLNSPRHKAMLHGSWGALYADTGRPEAAAAEYQKQVALLQTMDAPGDLAGAQMNLGKLYGQLGKFTQAIQVLEAVLPVIQNDAGMAIDCQKSLAEAYARIGNFSKAYDYCLRYENLKDTILTAAKNQQIQNIEAKYENEKKAKTIAEQAAKLAEHRTQQWIGGLLLLCIGLFGAWQYQRRQIEQKQWAAEAAKNQLLEEQNKQLESANEGLKEQLEQAAQTTDAPQDIADTYITLTNRDKTRLRLGDILYVEAKGNFVRFYTPSGGKHLDWQQISHYENLLSPSNLFMRTHRSYMANRLHVVGRRATELTLSDGSKVPIAGTPATKSAVHEWLDQWLKEGHTDS